jgi:hypothetical protein
MNAFYVLGEHLLGQHRADAVEATAGQSSRSTRSVMRSKRVATVGARLQASRRRVTGFA